MRVSEKRQKARIRTANLAANIAKAIADDKTDGLMVSEVIAALQQVQTRWVELEVTYDADTSEE